MNIRSFRTCVFSALATAVLAGCGALSSLTTPAPAMSLYDIGEAEVAEQPVLASLSLSVSAPSWLTTSAMQYRLLYEPPAARSAYVLSRWAAPPNEMIQHALAQMLGTSILPGQSCRLQIELDEFTQDFPDAHHSRALLHVRATLYPRYANRPIASRAFRLDTDTATPDAAGGVLALRQLTAQLGQHLRGWLGASEDIRNACQPEAAAEH